MPDTPYDHDRVDYFVDGKRATVDDAADAPFTVVCEDEPLRCSVRTFQSLETYHAFGAHGRYRRHAAASISNERLLRESEPSGREEERYRRRSHGLRDEVDQLANDSGRELGIDVWSDAAWGTSAHDGPLLGSIIVHENRNLTGRFVYIPHWWPVGDFGWVGMDDRGSCVTLSGSFASLWEDTHYNGRKLDIFYVGWVGFPLWWGGWEDTASSGLAWGLW